MKELGPPVSAGVLSGIADEITGLLVIIVAGALGHDLEELLEGSDSLLVQTSWLGESLRFSELNESVVYIKETTYRG